MSADVVIRAEGLGKMFTIGQDRPRSYVALRDVLVQGASSAARTLWRTVTRAEAEPAPARERFWALENVDFEIVRGEVVGIVGRNGAGKSTLLKVLSRITEPTRGRVSVRGRLASLLEVGTGFHPELTGRENIYLNGAILGMSRDEVRRKFDEIVDFAEVSLFLDTPVKRYSSGMYVRLAFAVAAHLEPEILVVDEVLAVGDAKFQRKSQQKLREVSQAGNTVLFVSHSLSAVSALCSTGMLLRGGRLVARGPIQDILAEYAQGDAPTAAFQRPHRPGAKVTVVEGSAAYHARGGAPVLDLRLALAAARPIGISVDLRLKDALGGPVGFGSVGAFDPARLIELSEGVNEVRLQVIAGGLADGTYSISLDITEPLVEMFDQVEDALVVDVESAGVSTSLRTLNQSWGYGSALFDVRLAQLPS